MRGDMPIRQLKGIGEKTEKLFHNLGIYTISDLLMDFPKSYETYPVPEKAEQLEADQKGALLHTVSKLPSPGRNGNTQTLILDVPSSGRRLRLIWFHMPFVRSTLKRGSTYVFYGSVTEHNGILYMQQPQIFTPEQYRTLGSSLQPVYGLTKGISQKLFRKTMKNALAQGSLKMEYLPEDIRTRNHLSEYNYALSNIHFPEDEQSCILARRRFVFDEFFLFILQMRLAQEDSVKERNRFHFRDSSFISRLMKNLPYELTTAQKRAVSEISADMRGDHVMQRLLQGDVGSGKTVVAFLAMLDAAHNGCQAAIMAPTEVLARQHYRKLQEFCRQNGCDFPVVLLTGSLKTAERKQAMEVMQNCADALIVGTHALIQEKAEFSNLALVITDEQHRFGVLQREAFSRKGQHPHILVMSATPIPRTLALILYGDQSISVIDEVPARKKKIKNCVVSNSWRTKAWKFIEKEIASGHQAYVVCPLVEESEGMEGENVTDYSRHLQDYFGDRIKVGMLHGRMKPDKKDQVMQQFAENRIQVLVSTTVIEVGVDVPNATVMLIENADRFGLAQLHQLRGRVGRGEAQGYCIFLYTGSRERKNPRLEIIGKSDDGFYISSEDLKLRGPGDFFGIRQSGDFSFRIADVYQDLDVLKDTAYEAEILLKEDRDLSDPDHAALKERLEELNRQGMKELNL